MSDPDEHKFGFGFKFLTEPTKPMSSYVRQVRLITEFDAEVRTKTPIERFWLEKQGLYWHPLSYSSFSVAPFPVKEQLDPKDRSVNSYILHTDFWTSFWKPHFWPPRKRAIYKRLQKAERLNVPDTPPPGFMEWREKNKPLKESK